MGEQNPSQEGLTFLHKKFPTLQQSHEVTRAVEVHQIRVGEGSYHKPEDRIDIYLDRVEQFFTEAIESRRDRGISKIKNLMHHEFVVKPEEITESYFRLQLRVAREMGHGDINLTDELRQRMSEVVIEDQKNGLDSWIDYFSSSEAPYPKWFKYYVMRNVVKLGPYDRNRKEIKARSKGTTALFPELNSEAVSYVFDIIDPKRRSEPDEDPGIRLLKERANFAEMYAYAMDKATNVTKEQGTTIQGEWVKFKKDTEGAILAKTLQGFGTNWCTAGVSTAHQQLRGGDFYVYYTEDSTGENTIPRIAIRMEGNSIGEVRGVERNQNLEPDLMDKANEQMEQLPGADAYRKKVADMKQLTYIEQKVLDKEELTLEELHFLYEVNSEIEGFGHQKDPRIKKIRRMRNQKKDYSILYGYKQSEIALTERGISDKTIFFAGDFYAGRLKDPSRMPPNMRHIKGDAFFGKTEFDSLGSIVRIDGSLSFHRSNIKDLGMLEELGGSVAFFESQVETTGKLARIGGNADFRQSKIRSIGSVRDIGGSLLLGSLIEDTGALERIGGNVSFKKTKIENLGFIHTIDGTVIFEDSLIADFGQLREINGDLKLFNTKFKSMGGLQYIHGKVDFSYTDVEDVGALRGIDGSVSFRSSKIRSLGDIEYIGGGGGFL